MKQHCHPDECFQVLLLVLVWLLLLKWTMCGEEILKELLEFKCSFCLGKLRRLAFPNLVGQLSAKRDVQELPGRVKASVNYLRKVSFLSLFHQSALDWPVLCLCLTPPPPHPPQSCDIPSAPCRGVQPPSPWSLPAVLVTCAHPSLQPAAPTLPLVLWRCSAQCSCSSCAPFPGCDHLGVPLSCPEIPPASPAPAALPPLDVWVPALQWLWPFWVGTAAFSDSL